jgi:CPA1 family monovalent cation:H+ antiporter
VILLRLVWVFPFSYLPRYFSRRIREKDPYPPWQQIFLVGWAGMRGVDSLAAALALPLVLPNQSPFPQRNLILFLAFSVILSTLVLQGLSLPLLIRWMRVKDDNQDQREEAHARLAAAQAALERLEEEEIVKNTSNEVLLRLRGMYEHRVRRFQAQLNPNDDGGCEEIIDTLHQLLIDLLHTERRVVIELRDQGIISDDVLRRIERSLDFEELRLVQ